MTRPCLECYCNGHARTDIEGSSCMVLEEYFEPKVVFENHGGAFKITEPIFPDSFKLMDISQIRVLAEVAQISVNAVEAADIPFRYWTPVNYQMVEGFDSSCKLYGAALTFSIGRTNLDQLDSNKIDNMKNRLVLLSKENMVFADVPIRIEAQTLKSEAVDLIEDSFNQIDNQSGQKITRATLMEILCNMKYILVQATDLTTSGQVDVATSIKSLKIHTNDMHNEHIELCDCNNGYLGDSCEFCAENYYKNHVNNTCDLCDCNGHVTDPLYIDQICHPQTGECFACDIESKTTGFYCHECLAGYFGRPKIEAGCQECLCPHVAGDCENLGDDYRCTACPEFQEGPRCEQCKDGYWHLSGWIRTKKNITAMV